MFEKQLFSAQSSKKEDRQFPKTETLSLTNANIALERNTTSLEKENIVKNTIDEIKKLASADILNKSLLKEKVLALLDLKNEINNPELIEEINEVVEEMKDKSMNIQNIDFNQEQNISLDQLAEDFLWEMELALHNELSKENVDKIKSSLKYLNSIKENLNGEIKTQLINFEKKLLKTELANEIVNELTQKVENLLTVAETDYNEDYLENLKSEREDLLQYLDNVSDPNQFNQIQDLLRKLNNQIQEVDQILKADREMMAEKVVNLNKVAEQLKNNILESVKKGDIDKLYIKANLDYLQNIKGSLDPSIADEISKLEIYLEENIFVNEEVENYLNFLDAEMENGDLTLEEKKAILKRLESKEDKVDDPMLKIRVNQTLQKLRKDISQRERNEKVGFYDLKEVANELFSDIKRKLNQGSKDFEDMKDRLAYLKQIEKFLTDEQKVELKSLEEKVQNAEIMEGGIFSLDLIAKGVAGEIDKKLEFLLANPESLNDKTKEELLKARDSLFKFFTQTTDMEVKNYIAQVINKLSELL